MKKKLEEIAREDGRFSTGALKFVYETVRQGGGTTAVQTKKAAVSDHITGQTLCEGLRKLAIKKWGRLAMLVLNSWNIKTTHDFGEIVYLMIKHRWMSDQPTDSIDDFNDVYDFKTTFKDHFQW
jgi:uncharacterized repeat protein (TIGR04138 family)